MTVGEMVRLQRKKKGWNQSDLAEASGVSQAAISLIEKNRRSPTTDTLAMLAKSLGCTQALLLGEESAQREPTENELKFALFGGDSEEITDAQFEEVKRFARFIKERGAK